MTNIGSQYVTCPACKGVGDFGGKRYLCGMCHGKKQVPEEVARKWMEQNPFHAIQRAGGCAVWLVLLVIALILIGWLWCR